MFTICTYIEISVHRYIQSDFSVHLLCPHMAPSGTPVTPRDAPRRSQKAPRPPAARNSLFAPSWPPQRLGPMVAPPSATISVEPDSRPKCYF